MVKEADALAQLRDLHLPAPISWWPLAPGWYVVILILMILVASLVYFLYKKNLQAKPKKQALSLLVSYQKAYEKDNNSQLTSARISELLKRVALVYFPRRNVASLYGEDWVVFLNDTSKNKDFLNIKSLLLDVPFQNHKTTELLRNKVTNSQSCVEVDTEDLSPLIQAAQSWIKQRKVPCSN